MFMCLKKILLSGLMALAMAAVASAADAPSNPNVMHFKIADSSSSGTYATMVKQIKDVCQSDNYVIEEAPAKGGALENLEALDNNEVSAAFLHSDIMAVRSQADSKWKKYQTLVALYPEEIHVIALRNSGIKTGGTLGTSYGAKDVIFNSLSDLGADPKVRYKVGGAGGGVLTAQNLGGHGRYFDVVPFDSGKDLIPALQAGKIQAVIFVGGAPLANVAALDWKTFKLLPIGEAITGSVGGTYRQATISYSNLKSGDVKTLAPQATVVTRKYTVAKLVAPQRRFRECFYEKLTELQETPGTHAKWQQVKPESEDHGVWDWYEFPAEAATATAPAKKHN